MKNIILIGMPGSGKSTLGVLLAKALGRRTSAVNRHIGVFFVVWASLAEYMCGNEARRTRPKRRIPHNEPLF